MLGIYKREGLPRTISSIVLREGLEPVTSGFQIRRRRPNHAVTLPALPGALQTFWVNYRSMKSEKGYMNC